MRSWALPGLQWPRCVCDESCFGVQELAGAAPLQQLLKSIPHGFFKRSMLEALADHRVPLLRASAYIKCFYYARDKADPQVAGSP
jgi:Transcription mediator complex subunit Med12